MLSFSEMEELGKKSDLAYGLEGAIRVFCLPHDWKTNMQRCNSYIAICETKILPSERAVNAENKELLSI